MALNEIISVLREAEYPHWVLYEWSACDPTTDRPTAEIARLNQEYLRQAMS